MNEHYTAVLADLEHVKRDAEAGIAAIQRLMARDSTTKKPSAVTPIRKPAKRPKVSVAHQVIAFLEKGHGAAFTAAEVFAGLDHASSVKTVHNTLARLVTEKRIDKGDRGKFQAKVPEAAAV